MTLGVSGALALGIVATGIGLNLAIGQVMRAMIGRP